MLNQMSRKKAQDKQNERIFVKKRNKNIHYITN